MGLAFLLKGGVIFSYTEKQAYLFLLSQVVLGRPSEHTKDSPEHPGFLWPERCFFWYFLWVISRKVCSVPEVFFIPWNQCFSFSKWFSVPAIWLGTFPKSRCMYPSQPVAAVAKKTCHTTHLKATAFKVQNPHIAIQTLTSRCQSIISGRRKNVQSIVLWVYAFTFLRLSNSLPPWLLAGLILQSAGGTSRILCRSDGLHSAWPTREAADESSYPTPTQPQSQTKSNQTQKPPIQRFLLLKGGPPRKKWPTQGPCVGFPNWSSKNPKSSSGGFPARNLLYEMNWKNGFPIGKPPKKFKWLWLGKSVSRFKPSFL